MNDVIDPSEFEAMFTPVDFRKAPKGVMPKVGEWCQYDDTGRITCTGYGHLHELQLMAISSGGNYLFAPGNQETQYVVDGEVVDRQPCGYTLDKYTLKGCPAGTKIIIDLFHQYGPSDGGDIELEFSHAGLYNVRVDPFPYLPFEVQVVYEAGS